ncbi:hypothetical protein F4811DRAFT_519652 [Daldinia bambusicola]|nr:hypothetical protein F4811DRAFT_519652 [Daldinia bambusicola]
MGRLNECDGPGILLITISFLSWPVLFSTVIDTQYHIIEALGRVLAWEGFGVHLYFYLGVLYGLWWELIPFPSYDRYMELRIRASGALGLIIMMEIVIGAVYHFTRTLVYQTMVEL